MLSTERVAYWYFRLNGFFQMENFIVHPERRRGGQRTDADLIGVRFPFRADRYVDTPEHPIQDDQDTLSLEEGWTEIVIVEVKRIERCTLNGPWTNPENQNVQRVLAAIGCFETDRLDEVATEIYSTGLFEDEERKQRLRLIAVGREKNGKLLGDFPAVLQITWEEILKFIGCRLYKYRSPKSDNKQWDDQIKLMQEIVQYCVKGQEFDDLKFVHICSEQLGIRKA